eukprot:SAG11_NODE_551_length_8587_cov_6.916951_4_plen_72_part_00
MVLGQQQHVRQTLVTSAHHVGLLSNAEDVTHVGGGLTPIRFSPGQGSWWRSRAWQTKVTFRALVLGHFLIA